AQVLQVAVLDEVLGGVLEVVDLALEHLELGLEHDVADDGGKDAAADGDQSGHDLAGGDLGDDVHSFSSSRRPRTELSLVRQSAPAAARSMTNTATSRCVPPFGAGGCGWQCRSCCGMRTVRVVVQP